MSLIEAQKSWEKTVYNFRKVVSLSDFEASVLNPLISPPIFGLTVFWSLVSRDYPVPV